jgi:hypothetical protein
MPLRQRGKLQSQNDTTRRPDRQRAVAAEPMISCRGCKFYVASSLYGGLCDWYFDFDNGAHYEATTSPFDGKTVRKFVAAPGSPAGRVIRTSIEVMRAAGGPCGPDAVLRKSGLMERMFGKRLDPET